MGKFVILSFFQSIYEVFGDLFFILHGDLLISLAQNIYLDLLYIYTKFQGGFFKKCIFRFFNVFLLAKKSSDDVNLYSVFNVFILVCFNEFF